MPRLSSSLFGLASAAALLVPAVAFAKPLVSSLSFPTPSMNVPVTLSASVSGAGGLQYCDLWVESEDVGAMDISGNTATKSYTFTRAGVHTAFVFCKDDAGGISSGANTSVNVQGQIVEVPAFSGGGSSGSSGSSSSGSSVPVAPVVTTPVVPTPAPVVAVAPRLVKLACPAIAREDDACKAVYFVGSTGRRHAFPNAKVFFTWYGDFRAVEEVTPAQMAAYALGKNVPYRPGARLVKFTTDPKVYAVSKGGVLRWIMTEGVAQALYGLDWTAKVDDIPDAFYTNYAFGASIMNAADFSPAGEMSGATTINEGM